MHPVGCIFRSAMCLLVEKSIGVLLITPATIPYVNFLYNLAAFVKAHESRKPAPAILVKLASPGRKPNIAV
jgi:hypothetical protein